MFCINCQNNDTRVTNSRPSKKQPSIWRRRACPACGYVFTTRETIAVDDHLLVYTDTTPARFSVARLSISIHRHLADTIDRADTAYWLAQSTLEHIIRAQVQRLNPIDIAAYAYETIRHFNPAAGLSYGLAYGFIDAAKPRRGRPPKQ